MKTSEKRRCKGKMVIFLYTICLLILPISLFSIDIQASIYSDSEDAYSSAFGDMQNRPNNKARMLTGLVSDDTGETLPGVSIFIKGTTINTITDIDGKYRLQIPIDECTVTFSYVGVKEQNLKIKKGNDHVEKNIILELNTELTEVVVTGIFKKAKESYTGSVSTIDKEDLKVHKGQNLLQTLRNADVSINIPINNMMGSNPNYIPDLSIRGNSSLPTDLKEFNEGQKNTNNNPLIIMDGFEISLTKLMDFNEDEIESINILKDASATAIYGSRGANGVIVVVSKTPAPGKISISADLGLSLEVPDLTSYDLLNASEKLELERIAGLYRISGRPTDEFEFYEKTYYEKLKRILSGVDTDWLAKPTRIGVGQNYKLRMDGGNEEFRWGTSVAYKDIQGAMKESFRRNFNGSITLMYKRKNFLFRNYLNIGVNRGQESSYGSFQTYAKQQPYNTPYGENGEILRYIDGFYIDNDPEVNPLYDATLGSFNKSDYTEITNNFSIEWEIIKNLTLRGQFGISSMQKTSDIYLSSESSFFNTREYETDEGFLRKGSYDFTTGKYTQYNLGATLSYSNVFKEKHSVYAGFNWDIEESNDKNYIFKLEGFPSDQISTLPNALQYKKDTKPDGYLGQDRRIGITGNMNYTFDQRYNLDLSFRTDGSSSFGSDKKYAPFWSAGIGWSLHNEAFWENVKFINYFRLKLSTGETGKMHTGQSGASTIYKYIIDNKYMSWIGARPLGLGNSQLTWEKTKELNAGTEMQFMNNHVRLEVDVYDKKTSNLLSYIEMPLASGFDSYAANIGEVQNKGIEIGAHVFILRSKRPKGWTWSISSQFAYNESKITKISDAIKSQNEAYLNSEEGKDKETANLFFVGNPQDAIYTVQSLGIDPSTGEEIYLGKKGELTNEWKEGKFVYQGGTNPKYRGNISNMLRWKGFTFNVTVGYYGGGKMYNETLVKKVGFSLDDLRDTNVDRRAITDRWSKPGDLVSFGKLSRMATRASSRFVMDNNTLTIQSVSLEYRWDNKWLKDRMKVQSVTFGVNVSDLYTFSSIKTERGTSYPYARNILSNIKLYF